MQGPTPPDLTDIQCVTCGETYAKRSDLYSEREEMGGMTDRTDYWCPACGEHLGTRTQYHGPVPVEIGPGMFELQ